MPYRQYTKCYNHTPGDRPFQRQDIARIAGLKGVLPGVFFGILTGLVAGLAVGGPIGAIIGAIVGLFSGVLVATALALQEVANEWRYHRLVCLDDVQCAVGTVRKQPERADLGEFDNDQYFDLTLMPHRTGHGRDRPLGPPAGTDAEPRGSNGDDYALPSDNYRTGRPGIVFDDEKGALTKFPANDVYTDGLQGQTLLQPKIADLSYDTTRSWLHCEAEGDFWEQLANLGAALGALAGVAAVATAAAGVGGALAGAAAGCAIGGIFGPIGCFIGAIIGAIIGALAAGGAAAAISYVVIRAVLQGIFDASGRGNVEDANVGDASLGPITAGDRVVVYGVHVYDGFHEGWHEIHPLMAVIKVAALHGVSRPGVPARDETSYYLEWDPYLPDNAPLPADLPDMPASPPNQDITHLSHEDIRAGLSSAKFGRRVGWIKERWCALLSEAFLPEVRAAQQQLSERWTIHPEVDGCLPAPPEGGPIIH